MSATILQPYIPLLTKLMTLYFLPRAVIHGSLDKFWQHDIEMRQMLVTRGGYVKHGIALAVKFLKQETGGKVISFCNSKLKLFHYIAEFKGKLDEEKVSFDIFHIHGGLHKTEKF